MGKRLFTESCVRAMQPGDELILDADTLATPSALDLAFARRIRVRYADRGSGDSTAAAGEHVGVWREVLSSDGTYVVEVRGGQPTVHRMTVDGPVLVSSMGSA